jgi:hypothetical protein
MTRIIVHNHLPKRRTRDARESFPNETPEIRARIAALRAKLKVSPNNRRLQEELFQLQAKVMGRGPLTGRPLSEIKDALGPKDPKWKVGGNTKPLSTMQITASVEPKVRAILSAVEHGTKKAREAIGEVNAIAAGVRREVEALGGDPKDVDKNIHVAMQWLLKAGSFERENLKPALLKAQEQAEAAHKRDFLNEAREAIKRSHPSYKDF